MARLGIRELAAVGRVIAGGKLIRYGTGGNGGFTSRFEALLAEKFGVKHTLTVNSGTSALICSLVAAGVGPGDEVLVPAYTWVSTAIAPLAVGAVPIIVDVDESLTIDQQDIKRKITPYTKAIIPVHMMNVVCDMDAVAAIAKKHNLVVIEDACQAVGVSYKGQRVGTIGHAGAFSFNQHKNMTSGEGGAVITNDDRMFTRARMYHDVGSYTREHEFEGNEPVFAGINCRVSEITGAILNAQLPKLDPLLKRLQKRREVMVSYLVKSNKLRISPHNDPDSAVGLSVIFKTAEEAKLFAGQPDVDRLIDSGRHIYTNWLPVMTRRSYSDRMNPYNWAQRDVTYSAEMCSSTLDILARTCRITLNPHFPLMYTRMRAKGLLAAAS